VNDVDQRSAKCVSHILAKKKYFHRLENDSQRNNINSKNKQKPEITNKNTGKMTCQYGQPAKCERCFETYVVIFTYIFRCSG